MQEIERELDAFRRALATRGMRMTASRRQIASKVFEIHDHITAERLLDELASDRRRVGRASVYRTLALLEDAGLITALDLGDGKRRYEHIVGHRTHDHIICIRCGRIAEFKDRDLDRVRMEVARRTGYIPVEGGASQLRGICPECSARHSIEKSKGMASAEGTVRPEAVAGR